MMEPTAGNGINLSWTAIAGFALFVASVGPGFYWLGRLSSRVESLEDGREKLEAAVERMTERLTMTIDELRKDIAYHAECPLREPVSRKVGGGGGTR